MSSSQIMKEAKELAELLEKHRGRVVIFTGAGVSTSADIPDYRGTCGIYTVAVKSRSQLCL